MTNAERYKDYICTLVMIVISPQLLLMLLLRRRPNAAASGDGRVFLMTSTHQIIFTTGDHNQQLYVLYGKCVSKGNDIHQEM